MSNEKRLVVYYSFEGNTRLIAEVIADAIGADIVALEPDEEPGSTGFGKYLWYGRQKIMNRRPRLAPLGVNPQDYDLIFVGAPIWASAPAPPVLAWLEATSLAGKRVALFCTHQGGLGKALGTMEARLPGATVVGTLDLTYALRDREASQERAAAWANDIAARTASDTREKAP